MKRGTGRIMTTHTGSLPRPPILARALAARDAGDPIDNAAFEDEIHKATVDIVRKQIECGLDIVNDGEVGKIGYATYVKTRLNGFGGVGRFPGVPDIDDFPEYSQRFRREEGGDLERLHIPACIGPIEWKNFEEVEKEIREFKVALEGNEVVDGFLTAASPGIIALYIKNNFYRTHEEYVFALAEIMRREYNAIYAGGFKLQLDCPDLAYGRHSCEYAAKGLDEFLKFASMNVAAINHALSDIPPEAIRLHVCWGNYEGPHHRDVDLRSIIDLVLSAHASGLCLEAANPRHEHEWRIFEETDLPEGKVLVPGVIDTCTNYVEHPDVVADRICRYAELVGRDNVIAGTDCGFATFAGFMTVDPRIAWEKLRALVEGARRATDRLWKH